MTDTPTTAVPGAMAMSEARLTETERKNIRVALNNGQAFAVKHALSRALDDIEALRAQVREAEKVRAEALEEAAKIVDGIDILGRYVMWPQWSGIGNRGRESELVLLTACLAEAIRSLAPQPAPTEGEK